MWWPSSDEPHQLLFYVVTYTWWREPTFLLILAESDYWLRLQFKNPSDVRGVIWGGYIYIYIYNYIYINITSFLKLPSHFDKQLAEKGTVIVISNQRHDFQTEKRWVLPRNYEYSQEKLCFHITQAMSFFL